MRKSVYTPTSSPDHTTKSRRKPSKTVLESAEKFASKQNNQKLMNCLQILNNQLNTKRSTNSSNNQNQLLEQFSALSKAYDRSQQKILDLQKMLMQETMANEKQRSAIEVNDSQSQCQISSQILKQVIQESMDDDTVLSFLAELSKDTSVNGSVCDMDLNQTLVSIRNTIEKRKMSHYLRSTKISKLEDSIVVLENRYQILRSQSLALQDENKQLRQQLTKLQSQLQKEKEKSVQTEKSKTQSLRQENMQLESKIELISRELERKNEEISRLSTSYQQQIFKTSQQYQLAKNKISKMSQCIQELEIKIKKHELQEESLAQKQILHMNEKERLMQILDNVGEALSFEKGLIATHRLNDYSNIAQDVKNTLILKDKEALKYKRRCEKLIVRLQAESKAEDAKKYQQTLIYVLKKFLNEEALKVVAQYEQDPKEYLEAELIRMSELEKERQARNQQCEKQLWRCKARLMQLEEGEEDMKVLQSTNDRPMSSRSSKFECTEFQM